MSNHTTCALHSLKVEMWNCMSELTSEIHLVLNIYLNKTLYKNKKYITLYKDKK